MRMLIVCGTLVLAGVASATPSDYKSGYCVELGKTLTKSNAILFIEERSINGGHASIFPREHRFFDPQSETGLITSVDWGGMMSLEKKQMNLNGSFHASYENRLHGYDIAQMTVTCIASEETKTMYDSCVEECGRPCYASPAFCGQW